MTSTSSSNGSRSTSSLKRRSIGIWICAGMAACPTLASEWASSGWSPGFAVSTMSERRFHTRGCSIDYGRERLTHRYSGSSDAGY